MMIDGVMNGVLTHKDGTKEKVCRHNLIVAGGFDFICDAMGASTRPDNMAYIAVGKGTDAVDAEQTSLGSEITRQKASYEHTEGTKIFTLRAKFAEGVGTGALTEAGVFNAASGGTMLDRVTFAVVNKGADDTFEATFQFTLS